MRIGAQTGLFVSEKWKVRMLQRNGGDLYTPSDLLHRGACWMQISDCRPVCAASPWVQMFLCVHLFLSQLSDHFRHAAHPKIIWRMVKGTEG